MNHELDRAEVEELIAKLVEMLKLMPPKTKLCIACMSLIAEHTICYCEYDSGEY